MLYRYIKIRIIILTILVLSFVQSFVPVPFSQTLYGYQGSYSLLISTASSSSSSSVTTDYLESLSLQVQIQVQQSDPNFITGRIDENVNDNDNDYNASETLPQQLLCCKPMEWNGKQISKNTYCVDLPNELLKELRDYANSMGIVDMYRRLLAVPGNGGHPLLPGEEKEVNFQGYNWMVQRPKSHWASNMHWTSPADETAHDDYLRSLSAGGFDKVLELLGRYFNLDALSAYHLSFIGVSNCEKGFIHADVDNSGRKAFNMIIPLILQNEEGPELEILSDDEITTRYYKYKYNVASMVGDNALHATAPCNYRQKQTTETVMRLAATIYIGDITPTNVNHLLLSLTQAYPPPGNARHLLDRAGSHWSKSNPSKKLPMPI